MPVFRETPALSEQGRESFIIGLPYKTIVELGFETVKEASLREGENGFKNGRLWER